MKKETKTVFRKADGLEMVVNVEDYDPSIHALRKPRRKDNAK